MSEQFTSPINFGDQRLSMSKALGDNFISSVEGSPIEGESKAITQTRNRLHKYPDTQLIGAVVSENDTISNVEGILSQQMGLPSGSSFSEIRDRLVGRENDFILVVLGFNNLSPNDQKKINKKIKRLGIHNIVD